MAALRVKLDRDGIGEVGLIRMKVMVMVETIKTRIPKMMRIFIFIFQGVFPTAKQGGAGRVNKVYSPEIVSGISCICAKVGKNIKK